MGWKANQGKILKRCDICGKFHASMKVEDPDTNEIKRVCQNCWKLFIPSDKPN